MDGGAWPFLVGGVICLVNSDNERDSLLLMNESGRRCDPMHSRVHVYPVILGAIHNPTTVVVMMSCLGDISS